jgi:two-component system OmpR family response regulator
MAMHERAMAGTPSVLVVEDDDTTREELRRALHAARFDVRTEGTACGARDALAGWRPDLVLLDVGLPDGDGLTLVTSAGSETERLRGFEVGADDYLVKPVSLPELVTRIQAVLARTNRLNRPVLHVGDVVIDEDAHTVTMCGAPVELTVIEFSLLLCLGRSPGRVISKVQLLTEVWGFDHYSLNLVEVHVSALRRKLEAHGPRIVHTVRGVGYVLRA